MSKCPRLLWVHLKDAHPIFGIGDEVGGQGIATFQRSLGQEALPHVLKDDVSEIRRFHHANAAIGGRTHHLE